jgi:hypothetical protein
MEKLIFALRAAHAHCVHSSRYREQKKEDSDRGRNIQRHNPPQQDEDHPQDEGGIVFRAWRHGASPHMAIGSIRGLL